MQTMTSHNHDNNFEQDTFENNYPGSPNTRKRRQEFQYPILQQNELNDLSFSFNGPFDNNKNWDSSSSNSIDRNTNTILSPSEVSGLYENYDYNDLPVLAGEMHQLFHPQHQQNYASFLSFNQVGQTYNHASDHQSSLGETSVVGEENSCLSKNLSQILHLGQQPFSSTATTHGNEGAAEAFITSKMNSDTTRQRPSPLQLSNINVPRYNRPAKNQLLIQTWDNNSDTSNVYNNSNNSGCNTPNFFTPGFLGSLQEDDNETYSTLTGFPFGNSVSNNNWNRHDHPNHQHLPATNTSTAISVEHDTMMTPIDEKPTITFDALMLNHNTASSILKTPSSPIPNNRYLVVASSISSSSSESPPIVHRNIFLNEQHQQQVELERKKSLFNLRLLQQNVVNEAKMKPIIRGYLSNQFKDEERTVVILTSKVAQKSYGTEKRFLCPPPITILIGTNWWTQNNNTKLLKEESQKVTINKSEVLKIGDGQELLPPKVTVSMSGEMTIAQSGQVEWYTINGVTVGQTGQLKPSNNNNSNNSDTQFPASSNTAANTNKKQSSTTMDTSKKEQPQHPSRFRSSTESKNNTDWYHNPEHEILAAGKCVSKHLFISDTDEKPKRVEALIKIRLENGIQLGPLASKGIKVISKPSKKRHSTKNMELCIHHGTTVSLFNRIRSQTVSTKYLGVSTADGEIPVHAFIEPRQEFSQSSENKNTCFVARTAYWDPFIIWIVDPAVNNSSTAKDINNNNNAKAEDYIGKNTGYACHVPYPHPPAIALKNNSTKSSNQLIPIHYNQHIVLQCLTTGLVSPVMIIRKVDKASTVVGGSQCIHSNPITDDSTSGSGGGGEYGDEVLGDPVSQLHKIALQIVQTTPPQPNNVNTVAENHYNAFNSTSGGGGFNNMMPKSTHPITYLACINDVVGMHKTVEPRKPIVKPNGFDEVSSTDVTLQEGGKIIRKRRVSSNTTNDLHHNNNTNNSTVTGNNTNDLFFDFVPSSNTFEHRYRVNSNPNDTYGNTIASKPSVSRKSSISSSNSTTTTSSNGRRLSYSNISSGPTVSYLGGAYWNEDVSDAAVWTIVGTDCATYSFVSPPMTDKKEDSSMDSSMVLPHPASTTNNSAAQQYFPSLLKFTLVVPTANLLSEENKEAGDQQQQQELSLHGENFSRDLQVWFGDIKSANTHYRSRDLIICKLPSRTELLEAKAMHNRVPILLIRGDGTICNTHKFYQFS